MPWEKSFNVDEAVLNAMCLFWKKGYSNASMSELLKATGLTKGSFYNAFGSKRELFVQAMKKYDKETRSMLYELGALDSPKKAIQTFFDGLVQSTVSDHEKKGCFVVNSLVNISFFDDEIQEIVKGCFQSVETFLKQTIELGQKRGEFSEDISPESAAKSLAGKMVSIRVLGRGTFDPEELQVLADQAISILY